MTPRSNNIDILRVSTYTLSFTTVIDHKLIVVCKKKLILEFSEFFIQNAYVPITWALTVRSIFPISIYVKHV